MPKYEAKQTEQVKPEAKAPAVLDKVTVDLEAEGDCWLEASADGKELLPAFCMLRKASISRLRIS